VEWLLSHSTDLYNLAVFASRSFLGFAVGNISISTFGRLSNQPCPKNLIRNYQLTGRLFLAVLNPLLRTFLTTSRFPVNSRREQFRRMGQCLLKVE
jgi:hypothetical protein